MACNMKRLLTIAALCIACVSQGQKIVDSTMVITNARVKYIEIKGEKFEIMTQLRPVNSNPRQDSLLRSLAVALFSLATTVSDAQVLMGIDNSPKPPVVQPVVYANTPQSYTASCPVGQTGNAVTVTIPAGTHTSLLSVAAANAVALAQAQSQAFAALSCTTPPPMPQPDRVAVDLHSLGFRSSNTGAVNTAINQVLADYNGKGKGRYRFLLNSPSLSGTVSLTNHRWLKSVEDFEVVLGDNVTLQNVIGPDENPGGALWRRKVFHGFSWYFQGGEDQQHYYQGDLFNTVSEGATSITLATPSAASKYAPGDRVFIGGFDQQFGNWPINLRYFEWKVVESSNTSTGVVTFRDQGTYQRYLKHSYNSQWFDNTYTDGQSPPLAYGKPRIWNISSPGRVTPRYAKFIGGTIAAHPIDLATPGGWTEQIFAADTLIYQGTYFGERSYPDPSQNMLAHFINTNLPFSESDKIVGKALFENTTVRGGASGGTGTDTMHYLNSTVNSAMNLSPRVLILEASSFRTTSSEPVVQPQNEGIHTDKIIVKGSTFSATGNGLQYGAIAWYCEPKTLTDYAISGNSFLLPNNNTGRGFVKSIAKGSRLWKQDGSQFVTVTDISWNGSQHVIQTNATLSAGTWKYQRAEGVQDLGGNATTNFGYPVLGYHETRWAGDASGNFNSQPRIATWRETDFKMVDGSDWQFTVAGNISDFTINVTQASTISGNARMEFYKGNTLIASINLKQTGVRSFSWNGGVIQSQSGDSFPQPASVMQGFWETARVRFTNGSSAISFNGSNKPSFTFSRTFTPFKNSIPLD